MKHLLCLIIAFAAGLSAAKELEIRNEHLAVRWDTDAAVFRLATADGTVFCAEGRFPRTGGQATVEQTSRGPAIRIAYPNGGADEIMLPPGVPFALFRATLGGPAADTVTNRVPLLEAKIDWAVSLAALKVYGTGGLSDAAKETGSYMWQTIADPATLAGVVGGWTTTERGSGVVLTGPGGTGPRMRAQLDYGRLRLKAGRPEALETFALGWFADTRAGMEAYADLVASGLNVRLPPQPVGYCTWYSDRHGGAGEEKSLTELAEFAARELKPYGFTYVQIDDGWQLGVKKNGPAKVFGGHRTDGPYPSGLKTSADRIRQVGLTPGIWWMPFAGTHDDPFFKDHPDWFVRTADGKPFDTAWGGTCLDMTHPGARDYIAGIARLIAKDWGYTFFKLDGLYTGAGVKQVYVNDVYREDEIGDAVFHNPDKTNVEAYRDGLRLVREAAGPDVFLLGCCVSQNMRSYGGAFGLVDAMRIGPDNGHAWDGMKRGPIWGARSFHLHRRIWYNDPDPHYVRAALPENEARCLSSWVAVSGQLNANSDWIPDLPSNRVDLLKRTMPSHGLAARPVDLFENEPARVWHVRDDRGGARRDVVGLFNWTDAPLEIAVPAARLALPADAPLLAFDYWANAFLPPATGAVRAAVPARSCRILALRAGVDRPAVLSTSRGVMQGIGDLAEETWDAARGELRGRVRVVGGDACELRVTAPAGSDAAWELAAAELAPAPGAAIRHQGRPGFARVTLTSAASRELAWTLRFRRQPVDPAAKPAAVTDLRGAATWRDGVRLEWPPAGDGVSYEVRRDGGEPVRLDAPGCRDAKVENGRTYAYAVTVMEWSGARSEAATVQVAVPPAPEPGPVPPKPAVSVATLKPVKATVGWGQFGVGKSAQGNPLKVGGKDYADGIGVHAASEVVYERKKEWTRFVAVGGIDGEVQEDERASVVLKVIAERPRGAEVLAESPVLRNGPRDRWHFDVALPADTRRLRLVVEDGGDDNKADHADWVDAGFLEH